jgi:hypothetical protein
MLWRKNRLKQKSWQLKKTKILKTESKMQMLLTSTRVVKMMKGCTQPSKKKKPSENHCFLSHLQAKTKMALSSRPHN